MLLNNLFDKDTARTAVKWMLYAAFGLVGFLILILLCPPLALTLAIALAVLKVFLIFYVIARVVKFIRKFVR